MATTKYQSLLLTDDSGSSVIERIGGTVQTSDDNGQTFRPIGNLSTRFDNETLAFAQKVMPDFARLFRPIGTDLLPATEASLSTAPAAPVIDLTRAGGWYGLANAKVALNPVAPGGTTYNPVLGSVDAMTRPWMLRGRAILLTSTFGGAGTFCVFLSLDGSSAGGGGGGHAIQVMSTGSSSSTQVYLWLFNAAIPGGQQFSMGPDFVLGAVGGIPVSQPFTYALWFDMVNLRWALNDKINPANVLSVPNLDAFPSDATAVNTSNDAGVATNFKVDALACAFAAAVG